MIPRTSIGLCRGHTHKALVRTPGKGTNAAVFANMLERRGAIQGCRFPIREQSRMHVDGAWRFSEKEGR
jgi:hypothetical protein